MAEALNISLMTEKRNATVTEAVNKYFRSIFGFIRNRVSDLEDAEDIAQDVFYEFTESFSLTEPIEETASWLFRVARNKIIDRRRKKKPESLSAVKLRPDSGEEEIFLLDELIAAEMMNADAQVDNELLLYSINEALKDLPGEQREVFVLHEMQGKSFKEISEQTGVAMNTLLSRKRYAVLQLRKRLNKIYSELYNQ